MKQCIDCSKKITSGSKQGRCNPCALKYRWSKISKKHNYCIDCKTEITLYAQRCINCSARRIAQLPEVKRKLTESLSGKKHWNHKTGEYCQSKNYYCKSCGNSVTFSSAILGTGLCRSCSMLKRFQNQEERRKLSLAHKGLNTKEKHPNWKGGCSFEPYSLEWTEELKEEIHKRDKFKCQYCGITQKEHFKKYNQKLHVHHIDYNKKDCKENNLITLCISCNSKANFNRDYWYAYYTYIINCQIQKEI